MMPGRPTPRRSTKLHFCATNCRCQRSGVSGETTVSSSSKAFSPYGFGLARQEHALSVDEPDAPSAQSLLEQSVLSLKEFDDDQLDGDEPGRGDLH